MAPRSLLLLAVATVCAAPAAASASTISSDGSLISFRSGAKASDMALTGSLAFDSFTFADAADTLVAGAGCTAGPPVTCTGVNFDVRLGGGADRAKIFSFSDVTEVGGEGNDELYAYGNGATVTAGPGDDLAIIDTNGNASATGNGGDDTLYSGGFGGFGGSLAGGDGSDLVVGNGSSFNVLSGGAANDVLVARSTSYGTSLAGGAGADVLAVGAGAAIGAVTLDGGLGDDVIAGSAGPDTVTAGGGRDTIDVTADGQADSVTCGAGLDVVWADDVDAVAADCEVVHRAAAPTLPAVADALSKADALTANVATIDPFTPGPMFPAGH